MQIRHQYQATPAQVAAMLVDEEFLGDVAKAVGAASYSVNKTDRGAKLRAEVLAPSEVKRFVGDSLAVNLDLVLDPAGSAPYTGQLAGDVERMPAKMTGTATIAEQGAGSVVDYDINFTVSVPLVGRRLEQAAEPQVRQIIDVQQRVGQQYLAKG